MFQMEAQLRGPRSQNNCLSHSGNAALESLRAESLQVTVSSFRLLVAQLAYLSYTHLLAASQHRLCGRSNTMKCITEDLKDLTFIHLHSAVLCANCELIANETREGCCCACGSKAVMSVSRLLGGTVLPLPQTELLSPDLEEEISPGEIEAALTSISRN